MKKQLLYILLFFLSVAIFQKFATAQEIPGQELSTFEIENYTQQVVDLVNYLEGTLNFLGNPEAPKSEKLIVINDSYDKIFRDDKVQIEDDLVDARDVPLNKDVQAYMKDVEFFFREVSFQFIILDINHFVRDDQTHYFKVSINRDMTGISVEGDSISTRKPRFIEINLNRAENDLKIASIYTTKLNENQEARNWWNGLSTQWRLIFGAQIKVLDTISMQNILKIAEDYMIVDQSSFSYNSDPEDGTFVLELPPEREQRQEIIGGDTVPVNTGIIVKRIKGMLAESKIDISTNQNIRSLEPLSEMSELEEIDCSNTLVADISPLRNLNRLQILNISNTLVEDLSPLVYNISLKNLNCSYTLISNLRPISRMVDLETFECAGIRLNNPNDLGALKNLVSLNLRETPILNLSWISGLKRLQFLDVTETKVTSLDSLKNLKQLKTLSCEQTLVASVAPLKHCTNLEILRISNTLVKDISVLTGLPLLKRIYWDDYKDIAQGANQRKASALAFMSKNSGTLVIFESDELQKAWIELEPGWKQLISDATGIKENPSHEELHELLKVETLDLSGRDIYSLEPIKKLYNLKILNASGLTIDDFGPISHAIELEELDLSNTNVKNLKILNSLSKLRVLNLEGSKVNSLAEIENNDELKLINAENTAINENDVFSFRKKMPGCLVLFKYDAMKLWWQNLSISWKEEFAVKQKLDVPPSTEQLHQLLFMNELVINGPSGIINLDPLTMIKGLKVLEVNNVQLESISALQKLIALEKLHLTKMPITRLESVSHLKSINELSIENTPVEDLDPISKLGSLEKLNISGTQVRNLNQLSDLNSLIELKLSNTSVRNLRKIEGLTNLRLLECYNTRISSRSLESFKANNPDCKVVYY